MVDQGNMNGTGEGAAGGFMAGGPWGAAIGAVLGAAKDVESARQAAEERKRQAAMTRYSPWTGMHGTTVQDPSLTGDVVQGGAAGLQMGQNIDRARSINTNQQNAQANSAFINFKPQTVPSAPAAGSSVSQNPWMMYNQNLMGMSSKY